MRFWLQTFALVAVMFAGMELLSRVVIGRHPRLRVDPRFDKITEPDELITHSREGFSRGTTNELGHLDRPMPSPLPADAILAIGDSYTEARQVAQDARYTNRLEAVLGRRVYNAGHAGWSPLNALGYLRAELDAFRPATVIVQVSGNDVADIVTKKRAHVVVTERGQLEVAWPDRRKQGGSARLASAREMLSRSAFAGQLISSVTGLFGRADDDETGGASCEILDSLAVRAMPWILSELRKTHRDVRVLYVPRLHYHGRCFDTCAPSRVLFERAATEAGLPFIDPTEAMCASFEATRQPLHGFWNTTPGTGHLNSDGHAVVTRALSANLRSSK